MNLNDNHISSGSGSSSSADKMSHPRSFYYPRRQLHKSRSRRLINSFTALSCCFALIAAGGQRSYVCEASNQHNNEPTTHHQVEAEQKLGQQQQQQQQQHQRQQSIISTLLANEQQNGSGSGSGSSSSINLIPVDQPVRNGPGQNKDELTSPPAEPRQLQQVSFDQVDQGTAFPVEQDTQAGRSVYHQDQSIDAQYTDAVEQENSAPVDEIKQQQQQQQQQFQVQEQQFGHQGGIERRFGLFKGKLGGLAHYGAPQMSANYAYMSDACERCLASMSQQPPQSADLQEVPPPPPPPPQPQTIPVPVPMPMPVQPINQPMGYGHQQHPLKSKLFMKFPFFMKPSMFGGGGDYAGGHPMTPNYPAGNSHSSLPLLDYGSNNAGYWPQTNNQQLYQPTRPSAAIYLRPASAYNCIQATPPLYAAAASNLQQQAIEQQTINISPIGHGKTTKTPPSGAIKQQPFQQQSGGY